MRPVSGWRRCRGKSAATLSTTARRAAASRRGGGGSFAGAASAIARPIPMTLCGGGGVEEVPGEERCDAVHHRAARGGVEAGGGRIVRGGLLGHREADPYDFVRRGGGDLHLDAAALLPARGADDQARLVRGRLLERD